MSSSDPSRSRVEQTLYWIISILIGSALWTPVIVSGETLFPFQTGKGLAFRALIELASFFYLWLCLIQPAARPKRNPLFWSIAVYSGILLITSFTGISSFRSIWGNLERLEGAFGILHGVIMFVIAAGIFRKREEWVRLLSVSLAASLVVCWYALAQVSPLFRLVPVYGITEVQPGSTLGYHSFLATYAIFHIFFSFLLFAWKRELPWRIFTAACILFNSVVFVLTAVRGAGIGMGVSILTAIILGFVYLLQGSRKKLLIIGGSALIILLLGIVLVRSLPASGPLGFALKRMTAISVESPTAKTRLLSAMVSWKAFKERPLLGWGQDNFELAYEKYFNPEHLSYERAWFDRAHNKLAGVAVQTGAIGLAAYLAPFAIGFLGLIGILKREQSVSAKVPALTMVMLGVAYFVQNLFLFDTSVSTMLFFFSLALVGFILSENGQGGGVRSSLPHDNKPLSIKQKIVMTATLVIASACTALFLIGANLLPYRQALLAGQIISIRRPSTALPIYFQALRYRTFADAEIVRSMMEALGKEKEVGSPEWNRAAAFVCQRAEEFILRELPDPRFLLRLGMLYNERGRIDRPYYADARRVLFRALALAPFRPEVHSELGKSFFGDRMIDEAMRSFRKAVSLNDENPRAHWILGLAHVKNQEMQKGMVEMEKALSLGYDWDNPIDIENLTNVYTSLRLSAPLHLFYEKVVRRHPDNERYKATLETTHAYLEHASNTPKAPASR